MKKIFLIALAAISLSLNVKYISNKFIYKPGPTPPVRSAPNSFNLSRESEFERLPITANNIVFVGNSLTDMFELDEYFPDANVKNRGISGDITDSVLRHIGAIAMARPKKIFLEIGINDIGRGKTVDGTAHNIDSIVGMVRECSPTTILYVHSLAPTTGAIYGQENLMPKIVLLNEKIRQICLARKCGYIDLYNPMLGDGGLAKEYDCGDGIHLNGAGYALWKQKIDTLVR